MSKKSMRFLFGDLLTGRASLGTSTIISQLSMLLFLFVLKLKMTNGNFAAFLVALSIASIIGAAASMRSEVLITQADGNIFRRTLIWPIMIALTIASLTWASRSGIAFVFSSDVSGYTSVLAFAFALQAICQFILIQETQFSHLLLLRLGQAILMAIIAGALLLGIPFTWATWGFAIAMIVPFALWSIFWLSQKRLSKAPAFSFAVSQLRRSTILSLTILVNTAAVNIPVILCVATQNLSYAADFGFVIKIFGATATLANAMFGQLFMADNIRRDISQPNEARYVRSHMHQTSVKAIGFVTLASLIMIPAAFLITFFLPDFITHPVLAVTIAIAVIAQSGFSPVSAIGDIGKLENPFLIFYFIRITLLYGLLMSITSIDFSVLFAIINVGIYSVFWLYADLRIRRLTNG